MSWSDYGPCLDLEHLPRAWDLAERMAAAPPEVDRRRANRAVAGGNDVARHLRERQAGNSAYVSAPGC